MGSLLIGGGYEVCGFLTMIFEFIEYPYLIKVKR
jgi:hypothetical protein